MINRFGGLNISTKNIAELVHFYKDILEIPVLFEGYGNYDGVKFGFEEKQPGFWIWNSDNWEVASQKVELVFYVESLDKLFQDVERKGVSCKPPYVADWGGKEFSLTDLDGNKILFLEEM